MLRFRQERAVEHSVVVLGETGLAPPGGSDFNNASSHEFVDAAPAMDARRDLLRQESARQ